MINIFTFAAVLSGVLGKSNEVLGDSTRTRELSSVRKDRRKNIHGQKLKKVVLKGNIINIPDIFRIKKAL